MCLPKSSDGRKSQRGHPNDPWPSCFPLVHAMTAVRNTNSGALVSAFQLEKRHDVRPQASCKPQGTRCDDFKYVAINELCLILFWKWTPENASSFSNGCWACSLHSEEANDLQAMANAGLPVLWKALQLNFAKAFASGRTWLLYGHISPLPILCNAHAEENVSAFNFTPWHLFSFGPSEFAQISCVPHPSHVFHVRCLSASTPFDHCIHWTCEHYKESWAYCSHSGITTIKTHWPAPAKECMRERKSLIILSLFQIHMCKCELIWSMWTLQTASWPVHLSPQKLTSEDQREISLLSGPVLRSDLLIFCVPSICP